MFEMDPGFKRTRRESLFLILPWLVCCIWSVGYCYLFGYTTHPRQPGEITNLLPDLSAYDQHACQPLTHWVGESPRGPSGASSFRGSSRSSSPSSTLCGS